MFGGPIKIDNPSGVADTGLQQIGIRLGICNLSDF
jgi:hypothetical protein